MENQAREPRMARTEDHTVVDHMATVTNLARLLEVMDMAVPLVDMDLVILQRDPKLLEVMDTVVALKDQRLLEVMDMDMVPRGPRHLEVMDMDMDPRHLPRVASMVTIKFC